MSELHPGVPEANELQHPHSIDLTDTFNQIFSNPDGSGMPNFAFLDYLRTDKVRNATEVKLHVDLSQLDRDRFEGMARYLKAVNENGALSGKRRDIAIICRDEQRSWERNVFASGIRWINAE